VIFQTNRKGVHEYFNRISEQPQLFHKTINFVDSVAHSCRIAMRAEWVHIIGHKFKLADMPVGWIRVCFYEWFLEKDPYERTSFKVDANCLLTNRERWREFGVSYCASLRRRYGRGEGRIMFGSCYFILCNFLSEHSFSLNRGIPVHAIWCKNIINLPIDFVWNTVCLLVSIYKHAYGANLTSRINSINLTWAESLLQ
jgi:hypothetical protein